MIRFFLFTFSGLLFAGQLAAQDTANGDTGEKKDKKDHEFYFTINFPGAGYSHYEMQPGSLLYYDKSLQHTVGVQGPFVGNALNVFYGVEAMLPVKRFKVGVSISQQYIHILKFYNKSIDAYAEPLFSYYEQVHFQKLGIQVEYVFRKRQFSSMSLCANTGYFFPDKVYLQKYVMERKNAGAGIIFSWFLTNRTQFLFHPFFEYMEFKNRVRQVDTRTISFNQVNPDKIILNKIFSFNCCMGFRFNLFKVKGLPVHSPRFSG